MTATYWVLISDALMDSATQWPPGFRPVERGGIEFPGAHWWKCEDDGAPDSLNGAQVELGVSRIDGKPAITGRWMTDLTIDAGGQVWPSDDRSAPRMVGAACALRACGDACLEPGCECECHEHD